MTSGWINLGLGLIAFFLTFYFSWFNNTWQITMFRAGIGFIVFFLFGYLLRFTLSTITSMNHGAKQIAPAKEIELEKPLEEMGDEEEGGFQALPIASLHQNLDSQSFVDTIRTWTKEDREG
ncbi:MAG TPA: hypothetical protein VJ824_16275 [Bacillota bacterium]|nr:hypothetical protein [Bacillota bacterium]